MTDSYVAPPGTPSPPPFRGERLLLVVAGAPAAHGVPQWIAWARTCYPQLEVRAFVTRSALKFVTKTTLQLRLGGEVEVDTWDGVDSALHIKWAAWADVALVYPATLGYVSRLASGLTDTPSLLALQCTSAIVGVAPSIPPGGLTSPALRSAWETLSTVPDLVLVPPEPGLSLATGQFDGSVPPPLSSVLARLEERLDERAREAAPWAPDERASDGRVPDASTASTTRTASRRLSTRLLTTEIALTPEAGAVDWLRRTGPEAPAPFASVSPALSRWLERDAQPVGETDGAVVSWALGSGDHAGRRYRVAGSVAVAASLLQSGPTDDLAAILRVLGAKLARLHSLDPASGIGQGLASGGRSIDRLRHWLTGRAGSPPVAQAEGLLRGEIGLAGRARLVELCDELHHSDRSIVHGAASLGGLVLDEASDPPAPPRASALIGEDICLSDPRMDLGWLAGELIELRWARGDHDPRWQDGLTALFDGYGDDLGDEWSVYAALRIALHLHDYTAYVRADVPAIKRYAGFMRFLLERS
ncbi:hypothetical protein C5D07_01990 [Rathayibacter tritici]|uniref:flavoprotein n=1 Tax=Rathayibacter tritici TaxID=33888 RepID=UPI000CE89A68|nr:flavoprotein [Rathayibacter tritici]PPF23707.1 hypothetical protein C5C06_13840 [Rathayibacter tritici]PPI19321.1 hypothetical protein C5D07_01990 [Rathayibacter tritici]